MKKILPALLFIFFTQALKSQCVQACGTYTLNTNYTYSVYPAGTNVLVLADDDTSAFVPLGFTFNFYCTNYTAVKVCSNGFITFDNTGFSPAGTPYAQQLPNLSAPNGVIAYNWNDLDPSAGGSITYGTIGTTPNQKFIVTYSNVPIWSFGGINTGQIVLNESDGSIEIHTGSAINNGWLTHTQGIENALASAASAVPNRNLALWTATNSAVKWEKMIVGTPPTAITGNTSTCFGVTELYTCNNMTGATSYSWTLPNSWQGSSITTAINATTASSGILSVTATYSCGVSAPGTISVTVNPPPNVLITSASPPVLCSGNTVTITAAGSTIYTLEPGSVVGASPFILTPLANTTYSLYGMSSNSCITIFPPTTQVVVNQTPLLSVNSGTVCLGQTFTMSPSGSTTYVFSSIFPEVTPLAVGNYTYLVSATSANGCTAAVTSSLTVNPVPAVTLNADRGIICNKETATLTAGGATSYSWSNTFTTNAIAVTPSITTGYTVTGINTFGCKKTASLSIQVSACIGLEENTEVEVPMQVFPNPGTGVYTLSLLNREGASIQIRNALGQLIQTLEILSDETTLDIRNYSTGLYYVTLLKDGKSLQVTKLMKE